MVDNRTRPALIRLAVAAAGQGWGHCRLKWCARVGSVKDLQRQAADKVAQNPQPRYLGGTSYSSTRQNTREMRKRLRREAKGMAYREKEKTGG